VALFVCLEVWPKQSNPFFAGFAIQGGFLRFTYIASHGPSAPGKHVGKLFRDDEAVRSPLVEVIIGAAYVSLLEGQKSLVYGRQD